MKVGETLAGRYELRRSLGCGGSGEVFAAHDLRSRREIAVKALHGEVAADRLNSMASLLSAAMRIDHPVVVLPRVQLGLAEAPPFLAGELVAGEDLATLSARGPAPWARAIEIALACADGLIALADATGAAHRALKPGNVRVAPGGEVRLLDFGVAELGARPVGPREGGSFVEYRAPEQLGGAAGDSRSDVFSLGVLLFELLTGVHPYIDSSAFKVAHKMLAQRSAPKPAERAPGVPLPSQVGALVERMLAREPADRFKDIVELRHHLAVVRRSPGIISRARPPEAAPAAPAEELTQAFEPSAEPEDLTTAVNLRLLRDLKQLASPPPPEPRAPKSVDPAIAAPEPAPAAPSTPAFSAGSQRPESALSRAPSRPPAPLSSPERPAAPAPPAESEERTEILPPSADAERTLHFSIEDRASRRRAQPSVAESALDTTPTPPRGTPIARGREAQPAELDETSITDNEVTTMLVRAPAEPPEDTPPLIAASPRPAAAGAARAFPRGLIILNLVCLGLLALALYVLFSS